MRVYVSSTVPGMLKLFDLHEFSFSFAGWLLISKSEDKGQESSSLASYPINFFSYQIFK